MEIPFYKFDGAGNDFVVIDNREGRYHFTEEQVALLCHRRFGVGADGLMTLDSCQSSVVSCQLPDVKLPATDYRLPATDYDFEMHYYNSDGRLGSMCGNGGRCITAFAHMLGMGKQLHFLGYDGPHEAEVLMWDGHVGIVRLGMRSVAADEVKRVADGWFLDTGSPHYVQRVEDLEHYDVVGEGRRLRHRTDLFPEGANIDFVEDLPDGRLAVRTYERGVEDETWACGTGVTASAIVSGNHRLVARGGDFRVDFEATGTAYDKVMLTGPVSLNFTGTWTFSAQ
ncbi:MAG: diaminopimelate epimerase [Bacteroidales bacterium]|nr:diaminopimelate epimerase [Bacteroidales bacterium]